MTRSALRKSRVAGFALALLCALPACTPEAKAPDTAENESGAAASGNVALAGARVDLASAALARAARDEALALLVAALEADPGSTEARGKLVDLLGGTTWHLPAIILRHGAPVTRVVGVTERDLWVAVGGAVGTLMRWDLESLSLAAVMFPRPGEELRSVVLAADGGHAVVERGGVTLLCRADTLKPVRDIGELPGFVTPAACVAFSADGLLMAHPERIARESEQLVWRIRDNRTGEIIRSSEPLDPSAAQPLAAHLGADHLSVLHADGGLMRMPVAPIEEITRSGIDGGVKLRRALFSRGGGSALVLQDIGHHEEPAVSFLSYGEESSPSLEPPGLFRRDPWSATAPNLWSGILRDPLRPWVEIGPHELRIPSAELAPLRTGTRLTSFCFGDGSVVTAEENGEVRVHRELPRPLSVADSSPAAVDPGVLAALRKFSACLAGCIYQIEGREFERPAAGRRIEWFRGIDFDALHRGFPELDFSPLLSALRTYGMRESAPAAMLPMWDRLARMDATGGSWPAILEATRDLAGEPWHQELTAAVVARSGTEADPAVSPWLAPLAVERVFAGGDPDEMKQAIISAGAKGPAAAKALELALAGDNHGWIEACLLQAEELPTSLERLAKSRIAWLKNRKASAIAGWPDGVPLLDTLRRREDWEGWEQADFRHAFDVLRQGVREELAAIEVPDEPDAEQRGALAARLLDPATRRAVGRERYAEACLRAALVFSAHKEETETTLKLAELARNHGADPSPCLRAEAMAYTALGDFRNARDRWVSLITEHPVESQLPGDYAEAAYTSFENADPEQAAQILITGTHRFPNDANFALRAGWVSLLTGNAERAYRFLTNGLRIGYPPGKAENATLLLAIAAGQTGAFEDAAAFYQELIRMDDDWRDPGTIETLEWPEELKASLRQLVW